VAASTTVVAGSNRQAPPRTSTAIGRPLAGSVELAVAAGHLRDAERVQRAHGVHRRAAGQLHPVRGRRSGERVGDPDPGGGRVGVDRVGGGQRRKRRLGVEVQLGRHPGNLGGGRRWARLGEERAEQAPVQLAQRAGQDGQAILDAAGRQPDPGEASRQIVRASRLVGRRGGHSAAPSDASMVAVTRRASGVHVTVDLPLPWKVKTGR
jgi:hypothetical protein